MKIKSKSSYHKSENTFRVSVVGNLCSTVVSIASDDCLAIALEITKYLLICIAISHAWFSEQFQIKHFFPLLRLMNQQASLLEYVKYHM